MDLKSIKLINFFPTILYFGLCAIILIFDFGIWIPGSTEYPQFYIMPILYSLILLIILIIFLNLYKKKKKLVEIEQDVDYKNTILLFVIYLGVIWVPRQFMIWKFGVTYEKIPLLYLIVTQIVLIEGLLLSEFGMKKESLFKNILLGCFIAFIDISIMTLFNIILPVFLNGSMAFSNIEFFDVTQLITFP